MTLHKVIDDIIPEDYQLEILRIAKTLRWLYTRSTYKENHGHIITPQIYDVGQLVYPVIAKDERSPHFKDLEPLLKAIQAHMKHITGIHRIKFNLTWRTPESNGRWQMPHVDTNDVVNRYNHHWSMVYYVNDSDGDTVIFYPYETVRITPKRGRVLIFPGHLKHTATNPVTNTERIVINFVVETEKDEVPNL